MTTPVPPSGPGGKGRPARRLTNPRDSWPARYGEPLDFDPAAWGPEPDDLDAPAEPDADGPDADDARWAAENLNDDWHDPDGPADDGPGPDYDAMADADLELVHDACVELAPTLGLDEPTVLAVLRLHEFNAAEGPASILARFRARGRGLDDYVRLLADSVREVGGG